MLTKILSPAAFTVLVTAASVLSAILAATIAMLFAGYSDFLPPRRSKWICAPVEGRIQALHADLGAALRTGRWKQETCLRSGLA